MTDVRTDLARLVLRKQEVIGDEEAALSEKEGTSPWRRALGTADALLEAYPALHATTAQTPSHDCENWQLRNGYCAACGSRTTPR